MSINLRRISTLILIAMCLLLPSVTPAQASGPFFYTVTFTGPGTCTSTTIDGIPFTESFHLPAGTMDVIFRLNGVAFGKPFHQDFYERADAGSHTTDYNVPSTTLPYTLTQDAIYHSTAGELIIH